MTCQVCGGDGTGLLANSLPPRTDPHPLAGTPRPSEVLQALLEAIPETDARGYIAALAHAYARQETTP